MEFDYQKLQGTVAGVSDSLWYPEVPRESKSEVFIKFEHAWLRVIERWQTTLLTPWWCMHGGSFPGLPHGLHFQVVIFLFLWSRLPPRWDIPVLVLDFATACHPSVVQYTHC